jgi:hypothetical protein
MATTNKKQFIFNKYKDNLNLLIEEEFICREDNDVYICPLKLDAHKNTDEGDPLSLEHVPQESLGGVANILTQTSVNNKCGVTIDAHLAERLKYLENKSLLPNSSIPIEVQNKNGEIKLRGTLEIDNEGKKELHLKKNKNPPKDYDSFTKKTNNKSEIQLSIRKKKEIDNNYIEYALLKNAYLLFFEKTGYAFIFDDCFDAIREQILNPNSRLIPDKFYFRLPKDVINNGIYFIRDKGVESSLVVFELSTENYSEKYGVLLPLGKNTLFKISRNIKLKIKKHRGLELQLEPIADDFLSDITKIKQYAEWIDNI